MMKFAPSQSLRWATLALLCAVGMSCFACTSRGATAADRPAPTVKAQPASAVPKAAEMRPDPEPAALRADTALPAKPRDQKE